MHRPKPDRAACSLDSSDGRKGDNHVTLPEQAPAQDKLVGVIGMLRVADVLEQTELVAVLAEHLVAHRIREETTQLGLLLEPTSSRSFTGGDRWGEAHDSAPAAAGRRPRRATRRACSNRRSASSSVR